MLSASKTATTSGGYQISRSLRFNESDTTYLNRTPASTGNRKTYTFSAWIKRSKTGSDSDTILSSMPSGGQFRIFFQTESPTDTLRIFSYVGSYQFHLVTTQVFRDFSAWGHLVLAIDTTQATNTDRVKVYWNGSQITSFGTATYPSQNADLQFNQASQPHSIGNTYYVGSTSGMYNGYMTEMNFVDGSQLTPSSFGETNAQTGVWQPKAYSGSYGTNGFYLNFSDNSNTTAATLGKDYSGNGNNWTPNNFSVTAGTGNDSLVDVPTPYGVDTGVGGNVRGNYCTLNPLTTTAGTYSQGNLRYLGNSASDRRSNGTISVSTGKWYWEVTLANAPATPRSSLSQYNAFGFGVSTSFNSTTSSNAVTDALVLEDSGYYKNFSGAQTDSGTAFLSGDVLSVAVDLDANTFTFRVNNTSLVTGTIGGTVGRELAPIIISYDGLRGIMDCNFGQRPFAYTAPSGFKALCTQNLPTPTIGATSATLATQYFNPVTFSGTGTTNAITVGFAPDFAWLKSRSAASGHNLGDTIRGNSKVLYSNSTSAEDNYTNICVFNSNGVSLANTSDANGNGTTNVGWFWKGGGTAVSNTSGSITSTVSANTTSGFSVVTYTGTGANATVGHGLGVAPKMIIGRSRTTSGGWPVYHASLPDPRNNYLVLNLTDAVGTASNYWGTTSPTSTTFSLSTYGGNNNTGDAFVMYCFAPVAGYSAFGSYTGNGSTDGPFVYTGFRPAFVLTKRTDSTSDWQLMDDARDTFNVANKGLFPNLSVAETTGYNKDFLSNGFKIRDSGSSLNASGGTFIYMAFAENPFKYSLAR